MIWQYIIIILILLVIAFAILRTKRKDFKLEANKLIEYLGGTANIIRYEVNNSRFVVDLHNVDLVDKEGIQKWEPKELSKSITNLKLFLAMTPNN